MSLSEERLAEIRGVLGAPNIEVKGDPYEAILHTAVMADDLLAHVDHLTAENARLRAGIVHARWSAEVNESNDTRTLHALLDDLADLLNPPSEGES